MKTLYRRVAGIDVHRMLHVVTVLIEQADGSSSRPASSAASSATAGAGRVAGRAPRGAGGHGEHRHLLEERVRPPGERRHRGLGGQRPHIKHVPGRKTDMADSEWLAVLGRFGLVRGSFIPPKDLRELRLVSRYRQSSAGMAREINRLHKILDDGGIKLGGVVSDINGVSARAMVAALIEGEEPSAACSAWQGGCSNKREDLLRAWKATLSAPPVRAAEPQGHIRQLEAQLAEIDAYLLAPCSPTLGLGAAADHPRHRRDRRGHDPHRDRRRHGPLRLGRAPGLLGRPESGQPRERRQAQERENAQRQQHRALPPVRSGQRGARTKSTFASKYQSLVMRKSHKKAIVALAHKMIRTIYVMLTRREPYRDSGIDYHAAAVSKNAPRWIRALKQFGYWPTKTPVTA